MKSVLNEAGVKPLNRFPMICRIVAFVMLLVATSSKAFAQVASVSATSPNGNLVITIQTVGRNGTRPSGGALVYSVSFDNKPLIQRSRLGLDLSGQEPLGPAVRIEHVEQGKIDQTYHLLAGKASIVRDVCNTVHLDLVETFGSHRKLSIEARAYDDAVAFRYLVPEQPGMKNFRLARENTEFRLIKDATAYALELPNYHSMYESEYVKLPVSALYNQGGVPSTALIGLPLLMDVPGVAWVGITEAAVRDYAAMYLVPSHRGGWALESSIAPDLNDPNVCVTGTLPHASPWRVIMVSKEPGKLIESNVITSLNPQSEISDTSWIHPGKASWDWWSGSANAQGEHEFSLDNMKRYVDFSADSGFEYMLVDAGWSARGDITRSGRIDIPALVEYAKTKNVRVWIWISYASAERQMNRAFPLYEQWGVAGVKIDFLSRDDQEMIGFYYRTAKLAAEHHLMVDFHGATKPTGIERTYPNVLGYEAVLGMEQSKFGTRDNPDNRLTIPFTRMLAGFMDYTPGGFDNVTRDDFAPRSLRPMVMGTRAQQLAMYVVYEAPFQMVSDAPVAYKDQPAFAFIKDVPASWDETRVLTGKPGKYIAIARRHGDNWYIGAMTNWTPRDLELPLDFLSTGKYQAKLYQDGDDADRFPKHVKIEARDVERGGSLKIHLAPGGGCAVSIEPAK